MVSSQIEDVCSLHAALKHTDPAAFCRWGIWLAGLSVHGGLHTSLSLTGLLGAVGAQSSGDRVGIHLPLTEVLLSQVATGRAFRTRESGQETANPTQTRTLALAPRAVGARPTAEQDGMWVN